MNQEERKAISSKLVALILEINTISSDDKSHESMMYHCRRINEIIKADQQAHLKESRLTVKEE